MEKSKFDRVKLLLLYFMSYAVIGWLYEVFLEVVVYRWGFDNRGVLMGPYLPIYGVGALCFLFTIYPLIKGKDLKRRLYLIPVVFLGCALVATGIELVATYILEYFTGAWPWQTYVDYDINFQARIALSPSIRFGLGGAFFLYVVQPVFEKQYAKLPPRVLDGVFWSLTAIMFLELLGLILL